MTAEVPMKIHLTYARYGVVFSQYTPARLHFLCRHEPRRVNVLVWHILKFRNPAANVSSGWIVFLLCAQFELQVPMVGIELTAASPRGGTAVTDFRNHSPIAIVHCEVVVKKRLFVVESANPPIHPQVKHEEPRRRLTPLVSKPSRLLQFTLACINVWHASLALLPRKRCVRVLAPCALNFRRALQPSNFTWPPNSNLANLVICWIFIKELHFLT